MSSNLASPVAPPNTLPQSGSGQIVTLSAFLAIDALLTVLADIAVILRLIIRKWIVKSVGWDDWTIVAATVSSHPHSFSVNTESYAAGKHDRFRPCRS